MSESIQGSSLDMLLLSVLKDKDMYGYEVIQKIKELSNNLFVLKTGTIYPLLHSLEKDGYIISYEKNIKDDRIRKFYHITNEGRKYLDYKIEQWRNYTESVNIVLNGE